MGANQSSSGGQAQAQGDGAITTSYYELLGVDRHADDDEIKKAYRRKALELHPDRNFGKEEEATRLFAEIQTAYEILSDPQERAWYDSHESAILRGGHGTTEDHYEHNVRITTADDITAMLAKFHGKINYSDAPNGFFGFLRDTFDKLAREEELAAEWSKTDAPDYPPFGHKDDTYEDVVREFYVGWSSFSTTKTFSWKDMYRYSDASDRRMRRLMEKENKRLREESIREFNEAVRTLVAFVRKRDPRYTPNTQTDEERQKVMREAAKAQAARQRAANAAQATEDVPEWAKSRDLEDLEGSEEEEEEQEEFECVACHKTFKSERQFEAHEKSKKHQKAVQALKKKMHKENRSLALDEDVSSSGLATPSAEEDLQESGEDSEGIVQNMEGIRIKEQRDESIIDEDTDAVDDIASDDSTKIDPVDQATKQVKSAEESSDDAGSDYGSRKDLEERLRSPEHANSVSDAIENAATGKKMGKAARKRAKKAAQQGAAEQPDLSYTCARCNAAFPSRSRLFQHIKDFDHAAPVPKGGKAAKGKGKK